jgi:hypothetical protein
MSKVKGSNPMLTERVFKRASPQGKTMTIGGIVNEQDSSHRFPPFLLFLFQYNTKTLATIVNIGASANFRRKYPYI